SLYDRLITSPECLPFSTVTEHLYLAELLRRYYNDINDTGRPFLLNDRDAIRPKIEAQLADGYLRRPPFEKCLSIIPPSILDAFTAFSESVRQTDLVPAPSLASPSPVESPGESRPNLIPPRVLDSYWDSGRAKLTSYIVRSSNGVDGPMTVTQCLCGLAVGDGLLADVAWVPMEDEELGTEGQMPTEFLDRIPSEAVHRQIRLNPLLTIPTVPGYSGEVRISMADIEGLVAVTDCWVKKGGEIRHLKAATLSMTWIDTPPEIWVALDVEPGRVVRELNIPKLITFGGTRYTLFAIADDDTVQRLAPDGVFAFSGCSGSYFAGVSLTPTPSSRYFRYVSDDVREPMLAMVPSLLSASDIAELPIESQMFQFADSPLLRDRIDQFNTEITAIPRTNHRHLARTIARSFDDGRPPGFRPEILPLEANPIKKSDIQAILGPAKAAKRVVILMVPTRGKAPDIP
ncbi:hypothetical protein EBR96_09650, partial [bacterium]|nr:hypothetical protein [bacterium]